MSPEYYEVGPGFLGFVVSFALALALWLLYRSMTKKVRRQKAQERVDAEAGTARPAQGESSADSPA